MPSLSRESRACVAVCVVTVATVVDVAVVDAAFADICCARLGSCTDLKQASPFGTNVATCFASRGLIYGDMP